MNKANNHISPQLMKHKETYDVGNPHPGLGHAHICGGVKPVNEIPTLFCIFKSYRDRNLQIDHKCSTECCIALYICSVNI